jgi:beta-lactamase class A
VKSGWGALALVLTIASGAAAQTPPAPPTSVHASTPQQRVLRTKLEARLKAIADRVDGVMGYYVIDLTNGERFGQYEQEIFPTASTIKLTILYELFKQVDAGKVTLDTPAPVPASARVGGSGLLGELTTAQLSLRDLAILMMMISDNSATNAIIERLGMPAIQSRIAALGLKNTRLGRRMMDTTAARRGDENVSTPAEIARILEYFNTGDGLSPASREAALAILTKPKRTAFTRTLPDNIRIASKPGDLDGVVVDAGIVFIERRPYIAAFMCTYLLDGTAGEQAIGEASRAVFDYFDRLGAEGSYGRRIR